MGRQIAIADESQMLAVWLWNEEGYFLVEAHEAFKEHSDLVREDLREAEKRAKHGKCGSGPAYGPPSAGFEEACATVFREFVAALESEKQAASDAAERVLSLRESMCSQFGWDTSGFYAREPRVPEWSVEFEAIADLYFTLPQARERLVELTARHRSAIHGLALAEHQRRDHLDGPLLSGEGRYLRHVYAELRALQNRVGHETVAAMKVHRARFTCPDGDSVPPERTDGLSSATAKLTALLVDLRTEVNAGVEECAEFWESVESVFRLAPGEEAPPVLEASLKVETVAGFSARLASAQARYRDAMEKCRDAVHEVARLEDLRIGLLRSGGSLSMEAVRTMHPRDFERLVAERLRRDGFSILQAQGGPGDLGADVIALSPAGKRVVVQCKHTSKGSNVGTGALQAFNGTAVPEHQADVAVVVTNGFYTKPALQFAGVHGIRLMGVWEVRRWIEWGVPVTELLA
ncbi:restriction endonuclease [Kitasatospora sp. NPDC058170]|uniref:restriction endonuclease n=1 Tax=Kitasatospora sp. NPDC058170 TaxID=3346364 RepID=UPI0036DB2FBF